MKKVIIITALIFLITPLFSQNIYSAIYKGSYDEVKKLLENGESPNAFNPEYGNTKNNTEVFTRNKDNKDLKQIIMERTQDKPFKDTETLYSIELDNVYTVEENTFEYPLLAAIATQNYEIADLLIESGAYLDIYQKFQLETDLINQDNYYFQAAGLKYYFNSIGCYYITRNAVSVYHSPLSLLYSYLYADKKNSAILQKLIDKAIEKGANPQYPNRLRLEHNMYLNERFIPFNMLALAILEKDIKNVKLLIENNHYINSYPLQSVDFKNEKYQVFPASSLTELSEKYSTPEITKYLSDNGGVKLPVNYDPQKALYKDNSGKYLPTSQTDILCIEREYAGSRFIQKYIYYFNKYGRNPYKPGTISHLAKIKDYKSILFFLKNVKMITPYDMVFIINTGEQDLIDEAMKYFDAPHASTYYKTTELTDTSGSANINYTTPFLEALINNNKELSDNFIKIDNKTGLDKNYSLSCLSYSTISKNPEFVSLFLDKTDTQSINNTFSPYGRFDDIIDILERDKVFNKSYYGFGIIKENIYTPFLFSLQNSSPEVISLFIKKGADLTREFELFSASHKITGEFDYKKKKFKPYSKDEQKNLMEIKKYENFTPLLYYTALIIDDDPAVVKLLADNGANINYKSPVLNETPVYHAGNYETLKILCDRKADLNVYNLHYPNSPTILWKNASKIYSDNPDYEKTLKMLIDSGADKQIKSYMEYNNTKNMTLSKYASEEKLDKLKAALK